jgi:hypothetical protein
MGHRPAIIMSAREIVDLDAVALSRAIKSKQLSCIDVMTAYLDHIDRINPRVNAIVSLQPREQLLDQAKDRDAQLARGEYLGWMHGFPHAVKDLEPTKGILTTKGSPLLRNFIPREDSISSARRSTPTISRRHPAAAVAARPSRSRYGCCPSPTAATTAGRCEIPRRGTMSSASELQSAACRRSSTKFSSRRFLCTGRWRARCRISRCFFP